MRIVDADRLKRSFEANTPIAFQDCVPGIHSVIDLEPTVEAEPVRHGHWIDIDSETYTWAIRCNKCGHERSMMSTQKTYPNYCEKCGAKMDERKE